MRHPRPSDPAEQPPPADPDALGPALLARTGAAERTARGAWFTPPQLADHLLDVALARCDRQPVSVLDPAVGGGAFLLAAHRRLPGAALRGTDVDRVTAEVARRALALAGAADVRVDVADGLDPTAAQPADVVVTNPPFLSQLRGATSRDGDRRERLRRWYGEAAAGYVDEAALFVLAAGTRLLRPGGVAVLIVPEAVLATAAAAEARQAVSAACDVEVVWRDTERVFPGVPTCAVALRPRQRSRGGAGPGWAGLLAEDVPDITLHPTRVVGDVATATADFREAYYTVAAHVSEAGPGADGPRVTPVGLIDPAHHLWGTRPVRFAKRRWIRPVATGLDEDFLRRRLGGKVLVATQTRVIEALVDHTGDLLPTTPVITVRTDRPWHVAAVLTSPIASVVAAQRHAGAARARGALKLSAKQVLALPLPAGDSRPWDVAAEALEAAHRQADPGRRRDLLTRCGRQMWAAFEMAEDPRAGAWWAARLPTR